MTEPRTSPYIWTSWLSRLLVGDNSCEWAAWFRAQHQRYAKVPSTFDSVAWKLDHTQLLDVVRARLEAEGKTASTEGQNLFRVTGSPGVTLGGRPDLIAQSGDTATIYEVKTGEPSASDQAQVMIYMYAMPYASPQFKGVRFDGTVVYRDHEVPIPADAVDESFKGGLFQLIRKVGASAPPRKVPSAVECRFCDITAADCPERVERAPGDEEQGEVAEF